MQTLTWTNGVLELLHDEQAVRVSINQEILDDIKLMLNDIAKNNLVATETLRSLAGKQHAYRHDYMSGGRLYR